MELRQLFADPPRVHTHADGRVRDDLALSKRTLRYLHRVLTQQSQTLETGVGASTVLFAMAGGRHAAITPDELEVARTRDYCRRRGISLRRVEFHLGYSEILLPNLSPMELDLVLIDGSHSFPTPFIDWYYTAPLLRIGGLLMIDDTQLWTCGTLASFLREESGWVRQRRLGRTVTFRKCGLFERSRNWVDQPFVARRSRNGREHRWRRLPHVH